MQPNDPAQQPPPQAQAVPPETLVPPPPAPPMHTPVPKMLFIVIGVLLVFLLVGGAAFFVFRGKQEKDLPTSKQQPTEQPLNTDNPTGVVDNNLVVFLQRETPASKAADLLFVYDLKQNKSLSPLPEFSEDEERLLLLGNWSPDGKYLPILKLLPEQREKQALYLYDATSHTVKKLYTPSSDDYWAATGFDYATTWLDSKTLMVAHSPSTDTKTNTITTISLSGKKDTRSVPSSGQTISIHTLNKSLQAIYQRSIGTTAAELTLIDLLIDGKASPAKPQGNLVGIIKNTLVTLEIPKPKQIFDSSQPELNFDPKLVEEMSKLESQNLTEEEKRDRMLTLLEGSGDTTLIFTDIFSGKEVRRIPLTDPNWKTLTVAIDPSKTFLVAHQADRTVYPKKERYIQIQPESQLKHRLLFDRSVIGENIYYSGRRLTGGGVFAMSADNSWLVTLTADPIPSESLSDSAFGFSEIAGKTNISAFFLKSGKVLNICQKDCADFRVYNPQMLTVSPM